MATHQGLPVLTEADGVRKMYGYWTTNPYSYYEGKAGQSQHPGPQVGWIDTADEGMRPVYGQSGQPGKKPGKGKWRKLFSKDE